MPYHPRRVRPDWFAYVREGDVLARGDSYRVVRHVSRGEHGELIAVMFTIKHRSWTTRSYTVYMAGDLLTFKFRYVGARVRLGNELDQRIRDAIGEPGPLGPDSLRWHHVRGVA